MNTKLLTWGRSISRTFRFCVSLHIDRRFKHIVLIQRILWLLVRKIVPAHAFWLFFQSSKHFMENIVRSMHLIRDTLVASSKKSLPDRLWTDKDVNIHGNICPRPLVVVWSESEPFYPLFLTFAHQKWESRFDENLMYQAQVHLIIAMHGSTHTDTLYYVLMGNNVFLYALSILSPVLWYTKSLRYSHDTQKELFFILYIYPILVMYK